MSLLQVNNLTHPLAGALGKQTPLFYTDKKKKKIVLIYMEIQMGLGAKSCVRKGFLIYEEMHIYFHHI
jgi:hypothetical protein